MGTARKYTYIDSFLGKKLREARVKRHLTQEQVGDALGITFQQIQKYEKGINRISSSMLYRLAEFLKTDIGYFFDGLKDAIRNLGDSMSYALNDSAEGNFKNMPMDKFTKDVIDNFSNIPSKEQKVRTISLLKRQLKND